MASIEKFEDIKAWQEARKLVKASAGEVRSQLYVASDLGYIDDRVFVETMQLANMVSKRISAFIKYLQETELKGSKFNVQGSGVKSNG